MKKKLMFVCVIGMIAILAYGLSGSGAWFTDVDDSVMGTVETGNFDLKVEATPMQLSNIEPGADYKTVGDFCVTNNGDYNMQFKGYLKDVVDAGNLRSYLLVKIEMLPFSAYQSNYGPVGGAVLAQDVPFTDLMGWNSYISLENNGTSSPEPFYAGYKACYRLSAKLSSAADNDQIASTLTATIYLIASQWINTDF